MVDSDPMSILFPPTRRIYRRRGIEIEILPLNAKRGPCVKCGKESGRGRFGINEEHHITYVPEVKVFLCQLCHDNITSVNSHAGMAKRAPLTNEERWYLWKWFLQTGYFKEHRRFSRGRARILLGRFRSGGGQVTDEEINNPANG